jgi:hypothetical protein
MEEAMWWTVGLDPINARVVWLKAQRLTWKEIIGKLDTPICIPTAKNYRNYALWIITERLNGKSFQKLPTQNAVMLSIDIHRATEKLRRTKKRRHKAY